MKKIILDNKNKVVQEFEHEDALKDLMQDMLENMLKITHYRTKIVNHLDGYYDITIYHGDGYKTQYKDVYKNYLYYHMKSIE